MARRLVWSPEAIEDVEAISSYIERDSPWYARVVVSRIVAVAETMLEFRRIYRIYADRIRLIAVIHGNRLLQSATPGLAGR